MIKQFNYKIKSLSEILKLCKERNIHHIWKNEDVYLYKHDGKIELYIRKIMIKKMGDEKLYTFQTYERLKNSNSLADIFCVEDRYFYCSWWLMNGDFFEEREFEI